MIIILTLNCGDILKFDTALHPIWIASVDNNGKPRYYIRPSKFGKAIKSWKNRGYKIDILKR